MNNTNTNNVDGKSSKVGTDQGMSKKRKMNTYEEVNANQTLPPIQSIRYQMSKYKEPSHRKHRAREK